MTPEEYAAQQAIISAAIARYVLSLAQFVTRPALAVSEWLRLLELIFPEISRRRDQSAALARTFYDSQREQFHPELPRNERPLEGTGFREFVSNMDPVRERMSQADSPQDAVAALALRAVREVENAGRQQTIHAVKNDDDLKAFLERVRRGTPQETPVEPEPSPVIEAPAANERRQTNSRTINLIERWAEVNASRDETPRPVLGYDGEPVRRSSTLIQGWARVATGRETCAWCLMLVSRGPVYGAAARAGLDLEDDEAQEMIAAGEDVRPFMEQWHTGCDCKVIPVFDRENWYGKEAADRALELWNEATKEAISLEDTGLVHKSGKKKGRPFTRNELAINALRRRLERGEISTSEFAALAA